MKVRGKPPHGCFSWQLCASLPKRQDETWCNWCGTFSGRDSSDKAIVQLNCVITQEQPEEFWWWEVRAVKKRKKKIINQKKKAEKGLHQQKAVQCKKTKACSSLFSDSCTLLQCKSQLKIWLLPAHLISREKNCRHRYQTCTHLVAPSQWASSSGKKTELSH